jgi:Fic family protein
MVDKNLSYKITDKALVHIARLERNIAILNESEISSKARSRIATESLFDDLFAVNNFLKLNLTLGEVKKVSIGSDIDSKQSRLLSNIRQVFDFVQNNYRKNEIVFNFHLVQHVVKLLQSGILEVWDVGKIRTGSETLEKSFELSNQTYESADISNLLADAVIWVENEAEVHPLIKASVFMVLINSISPFVGLNFIASIVFFRLILEKYNYGSYFSMPLFKLLNSKSIDVMSLFNQTLSKSSTIGITEVITAMSQLLDELVENYKKDIVQFDYFDIKTSTEKLDLNERQMKLLKLLQQKVLIKRKEYIKLFKVSPMTAYRDLNYLVTKKLVVIGGQGKSTTYTLATKA